MATIDPQSTVSMWFCLLFSVILIVVRLGLRRWRRQRFLRGDFWCICAAILIVARLVGNHLLVLYGSTRILSPERRLELRNPDNAAAAATVIMGSKIILATRALLTCVLWSLKMAVLDLLSRLIDKMPYQRKLLYSIWAAFGLTFAASIITVFISCQPFQRYWQIYPDPGKCVIGNMWLFTYEISNIVTDVMLLFLSFFLVSSARVPLMQHLRLFSLFGIGIFLIAISVVRIVQGKDSRVQRGHTLWASLEVLFAVVVAVTPTIYALARNRHEHGTWNSSHGTYDVEEIKQLRKNSAVRGEQWVELRDEASMIEAGIIKGASQEVTREHLEHASSEIRTDTRHDR